MADNFNDFFDENTHWVEGNANPPGGSLEPPQPPKSRKEMRKRREKRKQRHTMVIIAVIVVIALMVCGGYFGVKKLKSIRDSQSQTTAVIADYPGPGDGDVQFTVEEGQGADVIAKNLFKQKIIKSAAAFTSVVMANDAKLYPGTFSLKKHMAASDVLAILSDSSNASGFLDVKSGERVADVLDAAASLSGIDRSEFDTIVNGGGSGILPAEAGGSFEGWFEPGSYNVQSMTSASDILKAMVDKRIAKLDELGVPSGSDRERVMIIASIAEAEVNKSDYYAKVTRVIENRLDQGMALGMDSTVAYGNNVKSAEVTTAMTQDASNPYNTYQIAGLPPTPISNPGDNAISAALNPEPGDWLYFCTVNLDTGETKFAATADEHNQNVAELRQWQAANGRSPSLLVPLVEKTAGAILVAPSDEGAPAKQVGERTYKTTPTTIAIVAPTNITGAYGTLPAYAGDLRCGSNLVHHAIHAIPHIPMASHHTTTGSSPNKPTDNPIGTNAVTSPNPSDLGTMSANAN